jgi:NAD(P)-dependent dehydrogenase (short-subunit alcohol dehydrogenase family)
MIAGRVVAVTGGGRGIGRAIAAELCRRGAYVAVGDIDEVAAKETATALPGRVLGLHLDVTDRVSFAGFLDATVSEFGLLDVLVNNAGIMPTGPFEDEGDELARRLVDVNVHGVILGAKLALERMLPRGAGHIVTVSSGAGYMAAPGMATYCGTKHAVVGLSEALRLEYRTRGIAVTTVLPGVIDTELSRGLPDIRGLPKVAPSVVAAAVVKAIERPRASVFVPWQVGLAGRLVKVLPAPVVDRVFAAMGAERGVLDSDADARAAYERRVRRQG